MSRLVNIVQRNSFPFLAGVVTFGLIGWVMGLCYNKGHDEEIKALRENYALQAQNKALRMECVKKHEEAAALYEKQIMQLKEANGLREEQIKMLRQYVAGLLENKELSDEHIKALKTGSDLRQIHIEQLEGTFGIGDNPAEAKPYEPAPVP